MLRRLDLDARLQARLDDLAAQGLARPLPAITSRRGVCYELDGQPVVGFCSNDYLDLATAHRPPSAEIPTGATASRLVCADSPAHRRVERRLATLAGTPDAVLFPSGYQLNVGVLPSLLEVGDALYSDALNHASLIDGIRLGPVRPRVLPHLAPPPATTTGPGATTTGPGAPWWVTESIFSMDGDRPRTADLDAHLGHGGLLYLDEAHALGLFPAGSGLARHAGFQPTVLVGTLGKAYGVAGAFAAASRPVCETIRTRARTFVFTTGVSPLLLDAIERAIDVVTGPEGDARRDRLWGNAAQVADGLGLDASRAGPIIPVLIGDNHAATSVATALARAGFHVQAIRPPTVPDGTARLRITVSAGHTPDHIDGLLRALRRALDQHRLPLRTPSGAP